MCSGVSHVTFACCKWIWKLKITFPLQRYGKLLYMISILVTSKQTIATRRNPQESPFEVQQKAIYQSQYHTAQVI